LAQTAGDNFNDARVTGGGFLQDGGCRCFGLREFCRGSFWDHQRPARQGENEERSPP